MSNEVFLITGIKGFISTHVYELILKKYPNSKVYGTGTNKYFISDKNKLKKITSKDFYYLISLEKKITIIHLATFFSLKEEDKNKIYLANIQHGTKVIMNVNPIKVKHFIYLNTLYSFSEKFEIKNSYYVKTKNEFSKYLEEISLIYKFKYSEIFIDNTFGINDKRKKLIPIIISESKKNKKLKLKTPNEFINLVHVENVCISIIECLKSNGKKVILVSKYDIKVEEIQKLIFNYINNKKSKFELTKKINNYKKLELENFEKNEVDIDYKVKFKELCLELQ